MEFFGQEDRTLDDKGRVPVPPRFRKKLEGKLIITPGPSGYLRVYPQQEEAGKFPPSQIWEVEIDKWGRILIPGKLIEIESASLRKRKEITWLGEGDYLEIRPREPVKAIEAIRSALKNIEKEVKTVIGKEVPYSEITVEELLELHRRGIAAPADGDKQVVVLTSE